ncbi:MAG: helix-turn-helix domain-containing protein [Ramlibacter sp.]|nr:helix-turn-helix domain-containing protein [Ramlibacter sp.]
MGISLRLQEERKRLGLTQEALAEKLGATKRSVINWEGGAALPGAEILARYALERADVIYILTGERDYTPAPPLTAEESVMLDYFRQAAPAVRRAALGALLGASAGAGVAQHINAPVHAGGVAGRNIIYNNPGGKRK